MVSNTNRAYLRSQIAEHLLWKMHCRCSAIDDLSRARGLGVRSTVGFVTRWTHGRTRHLSLVQQWRAAVLQSYGMALEGGGDADVAGVQR